MHGEMAQPHGWLQYAIPIVVLVIVFGLRARRMTRMRPLRLNQLWIVPAIYLVLTVILFVATPPSGPVWAAVVAALIAGAALGWQRGRMMTIHVDPETHALSQRGSPLAILFLLAIVIVKMIAQNEGEAMHVDVALLTDAALALALGMFTATRIEMYLRAKRLVAQTRAGDPS